jgi:hypothetical protein
LPHNVFVTGGGIAGFALATYRSDLFAVFRCGDAIIFLLREKWPAVVLPVIRRRFA